MQNTPRESKGRVAIGNADLIYNIDASDGVVIRSLELMI